ncbi:MAG: hypothetical protein ACREB9_05570 [Thermoplasmata archaeon]
MGTRISFEVRIDGGPGKNGGQVTWWIDRERISEVQARELVARLGFTYEVQRA